MNDERCKLNELKLNWEEREEWNSLIKLKKKKYKNPEKLG